MESRSERPWMANPADILNAALSYNEPFVNTKPKGKKKYPCNMTNETIDGKLEKTYNNGNAMLSPKFEDLDLSMIPTPKVDYNNGFIDDDITNIDWNQLNLDFSVDQKRGNQQNRVTSGTAIFGFSKHDRNLQLPNNIPTDTQLTDDHLSRLLFKQQEELKLALEQQRETNRKLLEELVKNKLQQKRLHEELSCQNTPIVQFSNTMDEINIYQPMESMREEETLNGSPTKKSHKNPLKFTNYNVQNGIPNQRKSSSIMRKMENLFQDMNDENKSNENLAVPHRVDRNIVTYGNQLISPAMSNHFSPVPNNFDDLSESIASEQNNSFFFNRTESSQSLGLGLHSDRRSSVNFVPSAPITSQTNFEMRRPSISISNYERSKVSFNDLTLTPSLKPPSSSCDVNDIETQIEVFELESSFNERSSPSPVLKSQGHFEGRSPQFQLNLINTKSSESVSPIKITRKLTTLPHGSIDIYVNELPDKQFECLYPACYKKFKRRYNVRSHIQTHLEDRPYKCEYEDCDKGFVRNHDLIRHKKCHSEKSYACPCGKKFNREDALIVHRSRMICSGGKKYDNVVIKRSPRKRGRPKKECSNSVISSPVKASVNNENNGYVMKKIEEQINNTGTIENGFKVAQPKFKIPISNLLLSPASSVNFNDIDSHLTEVDGFSIDM